MKCSALIGSTSDTNTDTVNNITDTQGQRRKYEMQHATIKSSTAHGSRLQQLQC
jgi:hypothetical protein